MVASDWNDEFILYLDEDNKFYYLNYYAASDECQEDIKVKTTTKREKKKAN
jgi:hypothetical protein